jgi:hypothetical protein
MDTVRRILYASDMTAPQIYVSFPGTAREAMGFYAEVFGGKLSLHTYEEFSRHDGPPDAIAHGELDGVVALAGSDAPEGGKSVRFEGLMLSLLGSANQRYCMNGSTNLPLAELSLTRLPKSLGVPLMARSSIGMDFTG